MNELPSVRELPLVGEETRTVEPETERAAGVWAYISPSRLNLWLKCPLAFKLRYIDGIESPTNANLFIGKMVHAGLERFYRHRQLGLSLDATELVAGVEAAWGEAAVQERVQFDSTDDETAARVQTANLLRAYLANLPVDEPRPLAVEAAIEAPLVDPVTGENLGIPLLGVIDLVLDDPTGPTIVDFKTAARSSEPHEITHEVQLTSYTWLFRQVSPEAESSLEIRSLIKTKSPQIQHHRYPARTNHHFARLFALIREYLDALDRGRFMYRPSLGCGMCDHRDTRCRSWVG